MSALLLVLLAAAPDAARGEQLYTARCGACHSLDEHGAGPKHRGVFGRKAGSEPGFEYSQALRNSKLTWNAKTLDAWLKNPNALVPGNKMVVQLANDPKDRADLIAWLKKASPIVEGVAR
ncbi:MAG TPA: c-type cytochrome [Archangium sp.]